MLKRLPYILTVLGLIAAFFVAGFEGVFVCAILGVLEVSLSFDNAVVNASILEQMTPEWRKRFLTWGILIAVFGMRLVFPFILEKVFSVTDEGSGPISAFGGMFLLLVALRHFSFQGESFWLAWPERALAQLGRLPQSDLAVALLILLAMQLSKGTLAAGLFGIIAFILVGGVTAWTGSMKVHASLGLFIYLEVLDASFSFDSVIGAFAITKNLALLAIGLGIGAMFVREITMTLVEKKSLAKFVDLEQGAYWAILSLAIAMLVDIFVDVPESVTGLTGGGFIAASFVTSLLKQRKQTGTKEASQP